jgi:heme-degrading monooxygenase HmoA
VVLEIATLHIDPEERPAFEAAFPTAGDVLTGAGGHIRHELRSCVERPGEYALLVWWESVDAHTVGFHGSPAFATFRAAIGAFFVKPPIGLH